VGRRPAPLPFIWIVGPEGAIKATHPPEFSAMNWLRLPAAALTLAGRHGTLVAAASIFIGLSVPSLSRPSNHISAKRSS
jgi:hypothetical protein